MPPYYPRWGIPASLLYTLYTPGYTTVLLLYTVYHDQGVRCVPLSDDEALGSTLGLIRKVRRIETLLLPKV